MYIRKIWKLFCSWYSSKVDQIQDIVTGNPTVIKMVVSFNRGARGQNTLRQLLAPVVKDIMDDKSLIINTSPVDVYKSWVNQLEMQTGEARWVGHTVPFKYLRLLSISAFLLRQIALPHLSAAQGEFLGRGAWKTGTLTCSDQQRDHFPGQKLQMSIT